jgi:hypothetical protein
LDRAEASLNQVEEGKYAIPAKESLLEMYQIERDWKKAIIAATELEKLQLSLEFLNSIGISKDEISVLFRLPTETGGIFNNYIREQELNSPVTEKTKAVFISSKVPKTILEKQLKFNCVVSFNFYNIHYSIRNLLKWHHNVINVSDKKVTKELNFGNV